MMNPRRKPDTRGSWLTWLFHDHDFSLAQPVPMSNALHSGELAAVRRIECHGFRCWNGHSARFLGGRWRWRDHWRAFRRCLDWLHGFYGCGRANSRKSARRLWLYGPAAHNGRYCQILDQWFNAFRPGLQNERLRTVGFKCRNRLVAKIGDGAKLFNCGIVHTFFSSDDFSLSSSALIAERAAACVKTYQIAAPIRTAAMTIA